MVKRKPNPQFLKKVEEVKEIWIGEAVQVAKNDFFVNCEIRSYDGPLTSHEKDILIEEATSLSVAVNRAYFQREILDLAEKYDEEIEIAEILKEWDTTAEKQIKHELETIKDEF